MIARPIVRDPDVLGGRWHFADTLIYIDTLVADFQNSPSPQTVRAAYRAMGLTDVEIDQALAFTFPAVEPTVVEPEAVAFTIHCECGITRQTVVHAPDFRTDVCPCGRIWQIDTALTPRLVAEQRGRQP
jgi:uncharacterized protein (DUF433 family)